MHLAWIHNDYKSNEPGFRNMENLLKCITGFLTGIDHVSDHQNGPCINLEFYNTLAAGERTLTSLMNNLKHSEEAVEVKTEVSEKKLINGIDSLLDQSLSKNEFKSSLTILFKDYDINEKSIIKKEDLPF